jgi:hypothetical protein
MMAATWAVCDGFCYCMGWGWCACSSESGPSSQSLVCSRSDFESGGRRHSGDVRARPHCCMVLTWPYGWAHRGDMHVGPTTTMTLA